MPTLSWINCLRAARCLLLVCTACLACGASAKQDPAALLRAKYESLAPQLQQNQFKQPLVLDSAETTKRLTGDIYALVNHPFDTVNASLNDPDHWCDVLLLHLNTKYCHAVEKASGTVLELNVGKKTQEKLSEAPRVEFDYKPAAATPDYLEIALSAADGPLGTSDYHIVLKAVALDTKTFLHLTYSYAMNFSARLAMQTYLGTVGKDKVGFTVVGKRRDGKPDYVDGVRGMVERNTMRYYLAIDTYLGAADSPAASRPEKRFQNWFAAAEQYPRQLHEIDRNEYLEMKRAEYARQQGTR